MLPDKQFDEIIKNIKSGVYGQHFEMHDSHISAIQLDPLMKALKDSDVTTLDLGDNYIEDEALETLAEGLKGSNIAQLYLYNNNIGVKGLEALAKTLKDSKVTKLYLTGSNIGDEGLATLATGLKSSNIAQLCLVGSNIGDTGVKALAEVLKDSKIIDLNLGDNNIGHEGIKALAEALKDSNVTHLSLAFTNIGHEGIKALAEALKDSNVTSIFLENSNIDAATAKTLVEALKDSNVTRLSLDGNKIGDESALAFAEALKSSNITHLSLSRDNDIQDEILKVLKQICTDNKAKINALFDRIIFPEDFQIDEFYETLYHSGYVLKALQNSVLNVDTVYQIIASQLEGYNRLNVLDFTPAKDQAIENLILADHANIGKIVQKPHFYGFHPEQYAQRLINKDDYTLALKVIKTFNVTDCSNCIEEIVMIPIDDEIQPLLTEVLSRIPDKSTNAKYLECTIRLVQADTFAEMLAQHFCTEGIKKSLEEHIVQGSGWTSEYVKMMGALKVDAFDAFAEMFVKRIYAEGIAEGIKMLGGCDVPDVVDI